MITRAGGLEYTVSHVYSRIRRLITPKEYETLVHGALDVIISRLRSHGLKISPSQSIEQIDARITGLLLDEANYIAESLDNEKEMELISMWGRRYEFANYKLLLRYLAAGIPAENISTELYPCGGTKKICPGLEGTSLDDGIEMLRKRGIKITASSIQEAEIQLDRFYYTKFFEDAKKTGDPDAIAMVGAEIDHANLRVVLRGHYYQMIKTPIQNLEKHLLPISYRISRHRLMEIIRKKEFNSISQLIPVAKYRNNFSKVLEATSKDVRWFFDADILLLKHHFEICRRALRSAEFFSVAVPLAYLYLKFYEIRNIRLLLMSKKMNIPPKIIKNRLIY